MSAQSLIESKLPVFTTPQQQLTFYADDPSTHKQILTVYNPYDFHVKFRVSCTDCSKYTVSDAQGFIKSNHSIDIVIHHKNISSSLIGKSDTVRVHLFSSGQFKASGKKDITILLLSNKPEEGTSSHTVDTDRFKPLVADSAAAGNLRQHPFIGHAERGNSRYQFTIFAIAAVIGLIALMLPNEGDENLTYPSFLHLSLTMKLVAAYVLGLITLAFFRT